MIKLSVVICAYNPNKTIFRKVINSLKIQTLDYNYWEIIVIDNNSYIPIKEWLDLSWHPKSKIIKEPKPGLVNARNRATVESEFDYLISVDDDTILCIDYLEHAKKIFESDAELGIIGGRSIPIYLQEPPKWINEFHTLLAIRDLGDKKITQKTTEKPKEYPNIAPILIAPTKACMLEYSAFFEKSEISKTLGRNGDSLASGEDNDINMFIYSNGYKLGYFPELKFEHVIPPFRTTKKYLSKMAFESNRSWVKMLSNHDIIPWQKTKPWGVKLRQIKAFFKFKAWQNAPNYIKWRGACGMFKGLSEI